ncbi:DNA mismatch repair protein MutS [Lutibacter sp. TH_r2]|uniref:DNA mismatch repair protein MutS n=1 Tax=Lutibacter sp. TH_r2 TaxID=3082083 RepID=UPI0029546087|nr:DNA mismatch repair protein MutS [Lutibacter sp. TH_r2]MDV7188088.1 DNA mismatch repair protein MutS [Lutibacter sp. TH_r2]
MKDLKVGDFVAVLDDVIKGNIIKLTNNTVIIEDENGFPMEYKHNEIVLVKENQDELARYSDIANEHLLNKEVDVKQKSVSKFKSDNKPDKMPPMEVDLHITSLTDSTRGMDNFDMLTIQLDTAKYKLEFAIRNRIPKVVFIHGVGAGVLKTELDYLFRKYPVKWQEASFKKYGLGATEVYILQNP